MTANNIRYENIVTIEMTVTILSAEGERLGSHSAWRTFIPCLVFPPKALLESQSNSKNSLLYLTHFLVFLCNKLSSTNTPNEPLAGGVEVSTTHWGKLHYRYFYHIKSFGGTFLVVQWLRFGASTAGGMGLIPGRELRFHMPHSVAKKNFFNK